MTDALRERSFDFSAFSIVMQEVCTESAPHLPDADGYLDFGIKHVYDGDWLLGADLKPSIPATTSGPLVSVIVDQDVRKFQ